MITLDQTMFDTVAQQAGVKPRIRADLKFVTSTAALADDWSEYEVLSVGDKSGRNGVLLLQPGEKLYAAPYELIPITASATTGRAQAIICDFCYTWQRGSNAASITLTHASTKRGIRFLCCGDLKCSSHVRTETKAAVLSRTQLHENLTDDDRVFRLKERILDKIQNLDLKPISL